MQQQLSTSMITQTYLCDVRERREAEGREIISDGTGTLQGGSYSRLPHLVRVCVCVGGEMLRPSFSLIPRLLGMRGGHAPSSVECLPASASVEQRGYQMRKCEPARSASGSDWLLRPTMATLHLLEHKGLICQYILYMYISIVHLTFNL